ncbi:MAG: hypothetical protein V1891_00255 [bacterium]
MFTKKIKIIISAVIISLFSAIIVFALKNKNIEENDSAKKIIIEELKNNIPEASSKQIAVYYEIANNVADGKCLGREDEKKCIAAVAFIKKDINLCYAHNHNKEDEHHKEEEGPSLKKCVNDILKKNGSYEVGKCKLLDGNDFFNCLYNLFDIYESKDECANLLDNESRIICEDLFNYKNIYAIYDRALCAEIKSEEFNRYCLETIIDKAQDTDGDGLTDLDEINKYNTHYLFFDTDGDGISDFDEVHVIK